MFQITSDCREEMSTNNSSWHTNTSNSSQPAQISRFLSRHTHLHHLLGYPMTVPAQGPGGLLVSDQVSKTMGLWWVDMLVDDLEGRLDEYLSAFGSPFSTLQHQCRVVVVEAPDADIHEMFVDRSSVHATSWVLGGLHVKAEEVGHDSGIKGNDHAVDVS